MSKGAYLPRGLFGLYLEDVFAKTKVEAERAGIQMDIQYSEVIDLIPNEEGFTVVTEDRSSHHADHVVLCLGNLPSPSFGHLEGEQGFFNSPYPAGRLFEEISSDRSVGVIGTSLSGIDAAISLAENGHRGKIICCSRRGRLPSVRGQFNRKYIPEILTIDRIHKLAEMSGGSLSLDEVGGLIVREIQHASDDDFSLDEVLSEDSGGYDYLQRELKLALGKERIWQSVIYSLNGIIDVIWHYLSAADKERYMNEFRSLWLAHRVSFPVQNAQKMGRLMRTDQLSVLPGVRDVRYDEGDRMFHITLGDPRTGLDAEIRTHYLINATGYSDDVTRCKVPMVTNLLKRGLAVPSRFGGVEVDFDSGTVVSGHSGHSDRLYALGALATGTYLFTNAFDVNVRHARRNASRIAERITKGGDPSFSRPMMELGMSDVVMRG